MARLNFLPIFVLLTLVALNSVVLGAKIDKFLLRDIRQDEIPGKLLLSPKSQARLDAGGDIYDESVKPVVLWHGMGDTAYGSINVVRLALEKTFPNISVFSIRIGNNALEDFYASYFVNVNQQIDIACKTIMSNELIKRYRVFNAIGFSQGGQFLRGLIQRCPLERVGIMVENFISLGGQHQGVFGLPNCLKDSVCEYVRAELSHGAYEDHVQRHNVQAEYWHDPLREETYRSKSIFMADINNELQVNQTYIDRLRSLRNFVLVKFEQDEMVVPRESSHFGFYEAGQDSKVVHWKRLDYSGRLARLALHDKPESIEVHQRSRQTFGVQN